MKIEYLENSLIFKKDVKFPKSSLMFEATKTIKEKIRTWGAGNIRQENVFTSNKFPNLGRENNIHCTVLYNIFDTNYDQITKILKDEKTFEVELGEFSIFENKLYDVFKVNLHGEKLNRLHRVATNNIKHKCQFSTFEPHLTIAFMKKNKGKELLDRINKKSLKGIKFKVDKLYFNYSRNIKVPISLKD